MTEDEILARLTTLFRDIIGDDDIVLTKATTADDIADWDSATHITLIVAVETEFGIRFTTGEIDRLENIGDFMGLIQSKTG
jgi:acyl carrier protein